MANRNAADVFNSLINMLGPAAAIAGYRACSGLAVGTLFAICTGLRLAYQLNKRVTIQMADELAEQRRKAAA